MVKGSYLSIMKNRKRKTRSFEVVRCLRCGKKLSKDESKNHGYGNSCLRKKNEETGRPTVF